MDGKQSVQELEFWSFGVKMKNCTSGCFNKGGQQLRSSVVPIRDKLRHGFNTPTAAISKPKKANKTEQSV
jgi:hypothetical protein